MQITSFDSCFGRGLGAAVQAVCISLFFSASLFGQSTANWQATSGFWSVASNWNCGQGFPSGCVPNGGTFAAIGNGGTAVLDINATLQSLRAAATLTTRI